MPSRKKESGQRPAEPASVDHNGVDPVAPPAARVLIAAADEDARSLLERTLRDRSIECDSVARLSEADEASSAAFYDVVVIDAEFPDGDGLSLARRLGERAGATRVVVVSGRPDIEAAVAAMRAGAVDLLLRPLVEAEALAAVISAIEASRRIQQQDRKIERLKRICKRLNDSRRSVHTKVDALCDDLVGAYQELADQVQHAGVAAEFQAMISTELDIEALLRTMLEYMLKKVGATNAAVFLPSNHSDFSLGAYVNYDCPKDAADVLLDHLADVVPSRFEDETGVFRFQTIDDLREWIGDDASWLADATSIVAPCRRDGDCLAVMMLFRDAARPFADEDVRQVEVIGDLFAEQLERVIKVHHRHTPGADWTGWDTEEDDDEGDLAA